MAPRTPHVCPPCQLVHVDPTKIQVDLHVWAQTQQAAADGHAATREAMAIVRDCNKKVEDAVAAERAAAKEARSNDVTSVQDGNRLLRDQVVAQNADLRDREERIKGLLNDRKGDQERIAQLQAEVAQLRGDRADVSLRIAAMQAEVANTQARAQVEAQKWAHVTGMLKPLLPLLGAAAAGIPGGIGAAVAAAAGGSQAPAGGSQAPQQPVQGPQQPEPSSAPQEPEVIQAIAWSEVGIEDWKKALCEIVMATTPGTASAFRAALERSNVLALLDQPAEALPDMVRSLVQEAGAERIRRLKDLTAAARPA